MPDENTYADALRSVLQKEFRENLRSLMREEFLEMMNDFANEQQHKPMLTIPDLMELLHIGRTKTSELLARPGFPVFREAGVLIPRDKLFEWIDQHTEWVEDNTGYFKVG